MRTRIARLQADIENAEREIRRIRAGCRHPSTTPKMWNVCADFFTPSLVCDDCGDHVGTPSNEQIEELRNRFGLTTDLLKVTASTGDTATLGPVEVDDFMDENRGLMEDLAGDPPEESG